MLDKMINRESWQWGNNSIYRVSMC